MTPSREAAKEGLRPGELGVLVLGILLLTPLIGGALAFYWQQQRPVAGRQAWVVSVVLAIFLGVVWVNWVFRG